MTLKSTFLIFIISGFYCGKSNYPENMNVSYFQTFGRSKIVKTFETFTHPWA